MVKTPLLWQKDMPKHEIFDIMKGLLARDHVQLGCRLFYLISPRRFKPMFEAFQTYVRDALNLRPSALPPFPEMYTVYTDYSFSREGVGQQNVYNVYIFANAFTPSCSGFATQAFASVATLPNANAPLGTCDA